MYYIDKDSVIAAAKKLKNKRICLQAPEGVRNQIFSIAEEIERETDNTVFIWMDSCWGACDTHIRSLEAYVDYIFHFGHTANSLHESILFFSIDYDGPFTDTQRKGLECFLEKYSHIGVLTTVTYYRWAKKYLSQYKQLEFVDSNYGEGIILGCDITAAIKNREKYQVFLFVGTGRFHPLGICHILKQPIYILNPLKESISCIGLHEIRTIIKKRYLRILAAVDKNKFAIFVSTKPGQNRISNAIDIKKKLEKIGKKAFLLIGDSLTNDTVLGYDFDVIVNTACPRIGLDDYINFNKPVINMDEIVYITGEQDPASILHMQ